MSEIIKKSIANNKIFFPLIANYLEFKEINSNQEDDVYKVVSLKHNTYQYYIHPFYKYLSTSIDLIYYEQK